MQLGEVVAGRYRVTELLGKGGMAEAWRAQDDVDNRPVVIKTPKGDLFRPVVGAAEEDDQAAIRLGEERRECLGRFRREADLLRQLHHPSIPEVYETGDHRGRPFLAMQFVEGETLHRFLSTHLPLALAATAAITTQICQALGAAHELPVVHRDLKPLNILVALDGQVSLIDFGIAMPLRPDATRYTSAGVPVGSRGYMAPEQILERETTPQTDLYALGCILYQLLSGRTPFVERPGRSITDQHLHDIPLPLSAFGIAIPEELERIVQRLLSKEPRDRPRSTTAVISALAPHLPALGAPPPRPALTPDPTTPFRSRKAHREPDRGEAAQHEGGARPTPTSASSPGTWAVGTVAPRSRRSPSVATRSDIKSALESVLRAMADGDLTSARAELQVLLGAATRSLGRPHILVARVQLGYADSIKLMGESQEAAGVYAELARDITMLTNQGAEATYLYACARLGEGECRAAMGDMDDGLAAWKQVTSSGVAPEYTQPLDQRRRDLGLQLTELGIDDHELLTHMSEGGR
jgi:serine/threonine protein kinase